MSSAEIKHSASKIFLSAASFSSTNRNITKLSNSRMVFKIEPFILHNDDPSHFVLGLEQASVPMCFNIFTLNNNSFRVGAAVITIPVGSYDIYDLIEELNVQASLSIYPTMTFSYSERTNKISIVAIPLATTIVQPNGSSTAYNQLGFLSTGQTFTGIGLEGRFANVVNLTTTNGVIVRLNGINTNNRDTKGDGGGASVIARLPINSNGMTYLQYFNPVTFYLTLSNRVITQFDLELLDDAYQPLSFQLENPDWFVVLKLDYIEKAPNPMPQTKLQEIRANAIMPPMQPIVPKAPDVVSPLIKK